LAGLILIEGLLALGPVAWGETVTWTNLLGGFEYNHWANWDPFKIPAVGDTASFTDVQPETIMYNATEPGPYDFSFSNPGANAYTLEVFLNSIINLGNLTVNNSGTAGPVTISAPDGHGGMNLAAGEHTFTIGVQPGLSTILSLPITGEGGVNPYTGATTIGAGSTLTLNSTGTIAASSGVANSGTFIIAANKTIDSLTGAGALNIAAGGGIGGNLNNWATTPVNGDVSGNVTNNVGHPAGHRDDHRQPE